MNIYTLYNIRKCKRVYKNKKPFFFPTAGSSFWCAFPKFPAHFCARCVFACVHV